MNAYDWENHLLMVSFYNADARAISILVVNKTQEEVVEYITDHYTTRPHGLQVTPLTEETFEVLRGRYEADNRILGE